MELVGLLTLALIFGAGFFTGRSIRTSSRVVDAAAAAIGDYRSGYIEGFMDGAGAVPDHTWVPEELAAAAESSWEELDTERRRRGIS